MTVDTPAVVLGAGANGLGVARSLARARVPDIALSSPKITRKLTTAWFAGRVDARWKHCMAR